MLKNPDHIYGPSGLMIPGHLNFGTFVLEKLWSFKDKMAMIDASTNESKTYREIVQHSMDFAVSLSRMGLRKGDVVGLMSENRNEYWDAVIGVICTGAALATISPSYMKEELKNALNISKPKFLICSPFAYRNHAKTLKTFAYLEKIIIFGNDRIENTVLYKDLAVNVSEHVKYDDFKTADVDGQVDTLFIIYSSGTTGLPKGVMLTHLNMITACCLPVSHNPNAMSFSISPWYHVMGLAGYLTGSVTGRTGVYLPKFNVDLYLKTIEKYKIPQLTVVPPVLVAVCKWPGNYDLSSVKFIYSGAAPLHKDTLEAVYQKFPNLHAVLQGYGASETTLGVIKFMLTDAKAAKRKPGSVGTVVHDVIVKVVDETGKALGPNHRGEICVKGSMLMKGYVGIGRGDDFDNEGNLSQRTRVEAVGKNPNCPHLGFYKTGDVGYYDDERYFYVVDRLKELIKYKGFQVPPAELEGLLLTHSAVKDVGVIGIPHKIGGEVPMAFIVLQNGCNVTEKELQQYVAEALSNPKHLRGGVRFVDQIPKSASGKILRKELRELFKAGRSKL